MTKLAFDSRIHYIASSIVTRVKTISTETLIICGNPLNERNISPGGTVDAVYATIPLN